MDLDELEKRADRFRIDAPDAHEQWRIIYAEMRQIIHHAANIVTKGARIPRADYDEIHQVAEIHAWTATDNYRIRDGYDSGYKAYIRAAVRNALYSRITHETCQMRDDRNNPSLDQDRGEGDNHLRDLMGREDPIAVRREKADSIYGFFRALDKRYPLTEIERQVLACKMRGLAAREIKQRHGIGLRRQDNAWQRIRHKASRYIAEHMTDEDISALFN